MPLDENHHTERDEHKWEQVPVRTLEPFVDSRSGRDEAREQHQDGDQNKEYNAIHDDHREAVGYEYRHVHADIVSTVGEGDRCDCRQGDAFALAGVVIVFATDAVPCGFDAQCQRNQTEVGDCFGRKQGHGTV